MVFSSSEERWDKPKNAAIYKRQTKKTVKSEIATPQEEHLRLAMTLILIVILSIVRRSELIFQC
jgi:uncharacterized membrane protein